MNKETIEVKLELTKEEIEHVKKHCQEDYPRKNWGSPAADLFLDHMCSSIFMKVREAIRQGSKEEKTALDEAMDEVWRRFVEDGKENNWAVDSTDLWIKTMNYAISLDIDLCLSILKIVQSRPPQGAYKDFVLNGFVCRIIYERLKPRLDIEKSI